MDSESNKSETSTASKKHTIPFEILHRIYKSFFFWLSVSAVAIAEPIIVVYTSNPSASDGFIQGGMAAQYAVLICSFILFLVQLFVEQYEVFRNLYATTVVGIVSNIFRLIGTKGRVLFEAICLMGGLITLRRYPGIAALRCLRVFRLLWYIRIPVVRKILRGLEDISVFEFGKTVTLCIHVVNFAAESLSALGVEMFLLTSKTRGGLMLMIIFFYCAFLLGLALWIETSTDPNQAGLGCDTWGSCMYTLMRLTFYDGNGLDYLWYLSRDHQFLFCITFLYMCATAMGILNGLVGIFGMAFSDSSERVFTGHSSQYDDHDHGTTISEGHGDQHHRELSEDYCADGCQSAEGAARESDFDEDDAERVSDQLELGVPFVELGGGGGDGNSTVGASVGGGGASSAASACGDPGGGSSKKLSRPNSKLRTPRMLPENTSGSSSGGGGGGRNSTDRPLVQAAAGRTGMFSRERQQQRIESAEAQQTNRLLQKLSEQLSDVTDRLQRVEAQLATLPNTNTAPNRRTSVRPDSTSAPVTVPVTVPVITAGSTKFYSRMFGRRGEAVSTVPDDEPAESGPSSKSSSKSNSSFSSSGGTYRHPRVPDSRSLTHQASASASVEIITVAAAAFPTGDAGKGDEDNDEDDGGDSSSGHAPPARSDADPNFIDPAAMDPGAAIDPATAATPRDASAVPVRGKRNKSSSPGGSTGGHSNRLVLNPMNDDAREGNADDAGHF